MWEERKILGGNIEPFSTGGDEKEKEKRKSWRGSKKVLKVTVHIEPPGPDRNERHSR